MESAGEAAEFFRQVFEVGPHIFPSNQSTYAFLAGASIHAPVSCGPSVRGPFHVLVQLIDFLSAIAWNSTS